MIFTALTQFIPGKVWLGIGAAVAIVAGVWLYGNSKYRDGVRETTAEFIAADKKGAETVHETAKKTLVDIGDDPDIDSLLGSTDGWRD